MSGAMMTMFSGGSGIVTPLSGDASNSAPGSGSSTASVTFFTDGSIGGTNYTGSVSWYAPNIAGIGANYWISFSGGAYQQLNANRNTSLTGTNNSALRSVSIALDSGGVSVVAVGSFNLSVSNGV